MVIAGAGGAARAIAFEARRRGAEVHVANRTASRAKKLARELGVFYWSGDGQVPCDIVVNATSVGMAPHIQATPLPKHVLRGTVVFDAVYNPPMTKLLREAKSMGAKIVPGTEMYINQAARQFELYTGRKPDVHLMKRLLREAG
jgi:shikimate 5-dehydrogenase